MTENMASVQSAGNARCSRGSVVLRTRPRRIVSIAHSYVVTMNRRLAHELARADGNRWEVTAVAPTCFHGHRDLRSVHLQAAPDEPCRLVPVPAYLTNRVHVFLYGWRLRSLLSEPWDLVHCWEEPYILVGGQVAWWTPPRTPLVYRTAQSIDKHYPVPFNWVERYAMQRAAGWICSGSLVEKNLTARPGYDRLPRTRIPLGVDVSSFRPDPATGRALHRQLGWEANGPPVVGYLGRFVPEKGLPLLQRALENVATPWRALFVGAGPSEPALRAWAERQGDRVRICNSVAHEQVPAYLNAMDVLCAPSQTTPRWREQFGRMVVEAFASGLPFIGSDSGEIPYVVRDTGIVVGEQDEAGWARAITDLLTDRSRRQELAQRGLQRARDEFAWPVVARRYLDFFESLLACKYS
jgi:glycosyltransferase involved in cell wall biosynthesis